MTRKYTNGRPHDIDLHRHSRSGHSKSVAYPARLNQPNSPMYKPTGWTVQYFDDRPDKHVESLTVYHAEVSARLEYERRERARLAKLEE